MIGLSLLVAGFLGRAMPVHKTLDYIWPPWVVVTGMFLFRAAFSFSLSPLPYIMTSELLPQEARSAGVALTWSANWIANFVVCQAFPDSEQALSEVVDQATGIAMIFATYLALTACALCFVVAFLPESSAAKV